MTDTLKATTVKRGLIRNRLKELIYKGDFTAISDAVAVTTRLEQLDVIVQYKDLSELGKSVHQHPSLKRLFVIGAGKFPIDAAYPKLSVGRIQKLKVQSITDFLESTLSDTSLTSLQLDHIIYPESHLAVIGKYLSMPESTLKELYLEEFLEFEDYFDFFKLAKALYSNTSLEKLVISHNQAYFMDADLAVFAKLFKMNTTLTTFHLDIPRMVLEGGDVKKTADLFSRLTEALRQNPHITDLHLSGFGNLGGYEREYLFSENLRKLTLFKVLAKPSFDREVHLQNYRSLTDLVMRSQNLTHLTIHVSNIDEESVKMLADVISKNPVLKSLNLDFYNHQQDLAALVVNGIVRNTTLTKLRLYDESEMPENCEHHNLAQRVISRNRALHASLFRKLSSTVGDVKDSDFDENGMFARDKHTIDRGSGGRSGSRRDGSGEDSSKRQRK